MRIRKKTVAETFAELNEQQKEYVYGLIRDGLESGMYPYPDDGNPIFRSCTEEQKNIVRTMIRLSNALS